MYCMSFFFFQAEDGIRDFHVTGVQTCALPISRTAPENSSTQRNHETSWPPAKGNCSTASICQTAWGCCAACRCAAGLQIGRASCRERVGISGGGGCVTEKKRGRGCVAGVRVER